MKDVKNKIKDTSTDAIPFADAFIDKTSFTRTVEHLFHSCFLAKDGYIGCQATPNPQTLQDVKVFCPLRAQSSEASQATQSQAAPAPSTLNRQCIIRFNRRLYEEYTKIGGFQGEGPVPDSLVWGRAKFSAGSSAVASASSSSSSSSFAALPPRAAPAPASNGLDANPSESQLEPDPIPAGRRRLPGVRNIFERSISRSTSSRSRNGGGITCFESLLSILVANKIPEKGPFSGFIQKTSNIIQSAVNEDTSGDLLPFLEDFGWNGIQFQSEDAWTSLQTRLNQKISAHKIPDSPPQSKEDDAPAPKRLKTQRHSVSLSRQGSQNSAVNGDISEDEGEEEVIPRPGRGPSQQ